MNSKIFPAVLVLITISQVRGHGRLLEPPSRASMFRFENTDPMLIPYRDVIEPNYNDNQLFCGGRSRQIANGGKCGVCGDPFDAVIKEHEVPGKYALGIITRNYQQGQVIDVTVEITAPHKGYFEFRLCPVTPLNGIHTSVTQQCLDHTSKAYKDFDPEKNTLLLQLFRYLLRLANDETRWYLPDVNPAGEHRIRVQLPAGIACLQCVLQWRYRTGNSWGVDEEGEGLGHGQQEEFYGCSDVSIQGSGGGGIVIPDMSTVPVIQPSSFPPISNMPSQDIDCSEVDLEVPIFRDCNSYYICVFSFLDPFVLRCSAGTVCDPTDGLCKFPAQVPFCNIIV